MNRLTLTDKTKAERTVDELLSDMAKRLASSKAGVCPVDLVSAFLKTCRAQSCGKCVPCRVGLTALENLLDKVLDGEADLKTLELIEETAFSVYRTADCAIGYDGARIVLLGLSSFYDDFVSHITTGRCKEANFKSVPCVYGCPAHVDVPGYLALVAEGRCADAVKLIRKDNPLPCVCGLVCEHPCEFKCRRGMIDAAINIRGVKRYAVDHAGNVPVPECAAPTGKKVAVIGGGPGGLTAAYYLSLMGHKVTVYEEKARLGGMLRYGIPSYRLPRELLDGEIAEILSTGIEVKLNASVGKDVSLKEISENYDAIYVSIGAQTDKKLGIDGEDAKGVISAVEMLKGIGDEVYPDFTGKRVVVVGGGNVAMDVARSSVRLNAESVKVVYRRRKEDMTAQKEEVAGAIEEGCEIIELAAPVRVEKDEKGNVRALVVKPQIIGPYDRGRPKPVSSDKPEEEVPCDLLIVAIGQDIDSCEFKQFGLPVKRGCIEALNSTGVKDFGGIFAGGDCVTGPATVIKAVAAGKVAAANIDNYLGFNHVITADVDVPEARFRDNTPCGRVTTTERFAAERKCDFKLMEIGMSEKEARQESSRCLRCDKFGFGAFKKGREQKW